MRGLIIAAPRSGSGKTTVTLGLVAALRRRGLAVRTAKAGPDYIDPAFHAAASGAPGTNLDTWAMPPALLDALLHRAAADAELLVVETAMGLFDGVDAPPGRSGAGSDLAARYGLPVLLVLDVSGQAQTAAAVARGFMLHDPAVRIAGAVLNRVGSERHRAMAAQAIAAIGLPVLGAIPRDASLSLPERHLGLVQAREHDGLQGQLARLADVVERCVDLDAVLAVASGNRMTSAHDERGGIAPPGQRVGLAQDAAFSFVYPHVLAGWRAAGAEIVAFSPLADEPPPDKRGRGVVARRLSGAACRAASGCAPLPRRTAGRSRGPGAWRVRRLHGAGRRAGRRHGRAARDGGLARPRHQLRRPHAASRLPHRHPARRHRASWARIPLRDGRRTRAQMRPMP